MDMFPKKVNH